MSLVPIIYTTLILFFGLLLIVLIISYASFKAKGNVNPVIEKEMRKRQNLVKEPKSLIKVNKQKESEKVQLNYLNHARNSELVYNPKPVVVPYDFFTKDQKLNNINSRKGKDYQRQNIIERPFSKTQMKKSRIEIMNESAKYQHKESENSRENRQQYIKRDLSQINILSFYSDSIENDFMALNTTPITQAV